MHHAAGKRAVSALARETEMTEQTLYTWSRQAKGPCPAIGRIPKDGLRRTSLQ
ncbi:hypothetical protein FVF58_20065 [Paraburkholderia panacisoli]|uniref:Transposase n=1 Tax=Paraburkholderia panacisoli TaxID=2603818 RepID=A0A5B0H663_9BURK|nr:hypothetical protein FVF58_20065 [Paraburkholderia panacisoli]